jgi:hypothetical protein
MAEQRFERDLRSMFAADLDPVHGPHPRWADAPAARRVVASRAAPTRWRMVALLAAAAVGVLALALVLAVMPREVPVASAPPTSIEPWPSSISPSATPTAGEIALGRVAVVTANGRPAFLVRVSSAAGVRGLPSTAYVTIAMRVVGPLDLAVGSDRFVVVHGSQVEPLELEAGALDPLAIGVDAPVGTEVTQTVGVPVAANEYLAVAFRSPGGPVAFSYLLQQATPPASLEGRCPTLDDYAIASLQPSVAPVPPSFDPAAPDATPSTGLLPLGATGIVAAPDGSPGALVRVSNARICDRLPDVRPEFASHGQADVLLLADVEVRVLVSGTLPRGFIPGSEPLVAVYAGRAEGLVPLTTWMPGLDRATHIDPPAGFTYRGTMGWEIGSGDGRVAVEVRPQARSVSAAPFAFLVRDGTVASGPDTPAPTSAPDAAPTTGTLRPGETAILPADGGTIPVLVDGVAEVPRYPGLAPTRPGNVFLEMRQQFLGGSGSYAFDPADWVVVGPDGAPLPRLERPSDLPAGWPQFLSAPGAGTIPPEGWPLGLYVVVEAPATGRVTLEYQPDGGSALVSWVLRDR